VSTPARYLRFVQSLSLVSSAIVAGCGGSTPPTTTPVTSPSTTATTVATNEPIPVPTGGEGPCRCSWDTNQQAAPRVCKRGETNYDGAVCQPSARSYYNNYPVMGPLPPPDLARRISRGKSRVIART
jgi:hypothetical protein